MGDCIGEGFCAQCTRLKQNKQQQQQKKNKQPKQTKTVEAEFFPKFVPPAAEITKHTL
jgi:hypothetical protein